MEARKFVKKLKPFKEELYAGTISRDRLALYAVDILTKRGVEPTFDNITVTLFKLFPKAFSLITFPEYPDARTVANTLWHCVDKSKRWLEGNPKSGYKLTLKGEKILEKTLPVLMGKEKPPTSRRYNVKPERKEVYFINLLKSSDAFKKFKAGKSDDITDWEIRDCLIVTQETPPSILERNFEKMKEYAQILEEKDVLNFLSTIKERVKALIKKVS